MLSFVAGDRSRDPRDKRVVYRLTGRAGRRGSDATPAWIANELMALLWVHIAERACGSPVAQDSAGGVGL